MNSRTSHGGPHTTGLIEKFDQCLLESDFASSHGLTHEAATTELLRISDELRLLCDEGLADHAFRQHVLTLSPPKRPGYASYVIFNSPSVVVRLNHWQEPYIGFLSAVPTVHTHNWHMVSIPIIGTLQNDRFRPIAASGGDYDRYTEVGGFGTGNRMDRGTVNCSLVGQDTVLIGLAYHVAKGEFHAVRPSGPETITICIQYSKEAVDRELCLKRDANVASYLAKEPLSLRDIDNLANVIASDLGSEID